MWGQPPPAVQLSVAEPLYSENRRCSYRVETESSFARPDSRGRLSPQNRCQAGKIGGTSKNPNHGREPKRVK